MCARRLCFVLTIDDYNARAKDMGWTFKDEVPEVGGTKVNWECNHGHPVYACYHAVKLAHKLGNLGCKQCYRNSQRGLPLHLTEEQALQYFGKSKGIRWTGKTPPANGNEKTDWVCEAHGHKFSTSYAILKQGTGCPRCADKVSQANLELHRPANKRKDYLAVGKAAKRKLIGEVPRYSNDKTTWECLVCGDVHDCSISYLKQGLKRGNRRCMSCRSKGLIEDHRSRHSAEKYHEIAEEANLRWLGTKPPRNVNTPTAWECKDPDCGYIYERPYRTVRDTLRCPRCAERGIFINGKRASQVQVRLAERLLPGKTLEDFVNVKVGNQVVDIALAKWKIAIEYDSYYVHGNRDDRPRNKNILAAGWKLWRIRSNWRTPKQRVWEYALNQLRTTDRTHFVTTLSDWGRGQFLSEVVKIDSPNSLLLEV